MSVRNHFAPIHVIGGGLAGSEAAWQIARAGVSVVLHEMRPNRQTAAHQSAGLAELVCSNSFRADDPQPFGLTNPHPGTRKPYAVVQLRQDNSLGTLYNMVGFQTKLKHGAQVEIFRTIPGLENASFARLGGIHRNTFLNAPKLLDHSLRLKSNPRLRFAGQITGCEGYVESAAIGLAAGRMAAAERKGEIFATLPATTAVGALINHITGGHIEIIDAGPPSFQPMNINFGLFPPLAAGDADVEKSLGRKAALSLRAARELDAWLGVKQNNAAE